MMPMLILGTSKGSGPAYVMRAVGVLVILALITLATAFDYPPRNLLFSRSATAADQEAAAAATDAASTHAAATDQARLRVADDELTPETLPASPVGSFSAPVDVVVRPGDDRLFVVELTGAIVATELTEPDEDTNTSPVVVLDIADITLVEGERGLLGAAFHPSEDLLYVHYSNIDGDSVIAEYEVDPKTGIADVDSRREVLTVDQPYPNHNGGQVAFGPDGYLYLGFGDGGSANDPDRAALDLSTRLGKILRIDPLATDEALYTVPADNPFSATKGADPTIWSYGLRNPWKFSFDAETGGLWIADVGQNQWEEVNFAPADDDGADAGRGVSFGWSAFEGETRFNEDQPASEHVDPVLAYERLDGKCSISGGAVYRGELVPALTGWYVYGDYCTGQIFAFDTSVDGDDIDVIEVAQLDALVAISTGPDGELYALSVAGPVMRLG